MRVFAIRDEQMQSKKDLAFLFYFEREKKYYIEVSKSLDEWMAPPIMSSFVRRGQYTINSYWSRVWVEERIVPRDRQNLGEILRANRLKEYDDFKLLLLAEGRCAQDNLYIQEIAQESLPKDFVSRIKLQVESIFPISNTSFLVFFKDGSAKKVTAISLLRTIRGFDHDLYSSILHISEHEDIFQSAKVSPGGYGIHWGETAEVKYDLLHKAGHSINLTLSDIEALFASEVVTTSDACEILNCSRQNIDDLIKRKRLHPFKESGKVKLFMRSEIEKRLGKTEQF